MTDSRFGACDVVSKFHSNHMRVIYKKTVLEMFWETLELEYLFNKVADLKSTTLLKRDFDTGVFPLILRIFSGTFFI